MDGKNPVNAPNDADLTKALAKRLAAFVWILLFVSGVSLLTKLDAIDAANARADLDAIGVLDRPPVVPPDPPEYGRPAPSHYLAYAAWLQKNQPVLYDQGTKARQDLVENLVKNGVDRDALLNGLKEKPGEFTTSEYLLAPEDLKYVTFEKWRFEVRRTPRVADRLDVLRAHYAPRKARAVKAARLLEPFPALPKPDPERGASDYRVRARSFRLSGDHIVVELEAGDPFSRAGLSWQGTARYQADVEEIDCPTIGELRGGLTPEHAALSGDAEAQSRLKAVYGPLPVGDARTIASAQSARSYQRTDFFGLSVSARRMAYAVALFLLLALSGIFLTARAAAVRGLPIITGVAGESVLDVIIAPLLTRVLVFVVLPAVAVWAALPQFPLGAAEYAFLAVCWLAILALGVTSVLRTRRL